MYFVRKYLVNFILFGLVLYFGLHAVYGNRGYIAYMDLNKQFHVATSRLGDLESVRKRLDKRNNLLRPHSLDKDMLDEVARKVLNVGGAKEKIFNMNKEKE